ncbi:MAG TPA: hypothetical protein DCM14_00050 [Clostridiales bacterium UBA8153]|nr:hypothetical protein [Clostridiales bacterium UBA8153]
MILPSRVRFFKRCGLPDPGDSCETWQRCHHLDLPKLGVIGLWREEQRAELALVLSAPRELGRLVGAGPGHLVTVEQWLLARLAAVRREQARRGGAA